MVLGKELGGTTPDHSGIVYNGIYKPTLNVISCLFPKSENWSGFLWLVKTGANVGLS